MKKLAIKHLMLPSLSNWGSLSSYQNIFVKMYFQIQHCSEIYKTVFDTNTIKTHRSTYLKPCKILTGASRFYIYKFSSNPEFFYLDRPCPYTVKLCLPVLRNIPLIFLSRQENSWIISRDYEWKNSFPLSFELAWGLLLFWHSPYTVYTIKKCKHFFMLLYVLHC
jgi:hypothetical protein